MRLRHLTPALLISGAALLAACSRAVPSTSPAMAAGAANNAAPAMPEGVTPPLIALGDSLFNSGSCQRCHGNGGVGGENGPSLKTGSWLHADGSFDALVRVITAGVPREALKDSTRRPMRGRGGPMNLTDENVRAVSAYVWSISRDKK